MDGAKIGDGKYTCRGERELEPYMECFWYLGNKIPSLYTPGRTITEETVDVNKADRIYAHARILHNQGEVWQGIHDFITSRFMPRNSKGDRPRVIPQGSKNYAFVGQYVELDGDVVFTVETGVRTAMMAAYGLTGIDRKVLPLYQGQYDIRWLVMCAKKMMQTDEIKLSDLPPMNPMTIKKDIQNMLDFINGVPELSWDDDSLY